MAQKDYLDALLSDTDAKDVANKTPNSSDGTSAPSPATLPRIRSTTLLGRESALARIASGEVKQVTQVQINPARVRVWPGNARSYEHLTEANCRELIDAIIAEGGQKVPAIVRRVEGDPQHDYEVIAGTRRHWAIGWLRTHSYPDMRFLAQIHDLDDEAAFRLADIENRARKDVSDLERARNYAAALAAHYGGHQTRMAERLKLSKGWLSKMLKVAAIPDKVVEAFPSPADIALKPAYPLAQALDDPDRATAIEIRAGQLAKEQATLRSQDAPPITTAAVLSDLLSVGRAKDALQKVVVEGAHGRPAVTLRKATRQGVTIQLHAGHGLNRTELLARVSALLDTLDENERGLLR